MRWLEKEALGREIGLCVVGCLVLMFAYAFSVLGAAHLLKIDIPPVSGENIPIFVFSFPIKLIVVVFIEELIFRLPLAIVVEKKWSIAKVLASALVLSAIFGVLHGSIHHIFIQGAEGFICSVLFLKCGGLQGNYLKAVAVTTTTHFLFNAMVIGIAVVGGATSI